MAVGGVPHHITQRGNDRQPVFLTDDDRLFFLATLRRKCREHGLSLLGHCLMTNHYHLVAVPRHEHSLARALGQTNRQHALRLNRRTRRSGHFWQDRFFSCPLGPDRLLTALAYVDLNPVRARIVDRAEDYGWSSARAHIRHEDAAETIDLSQTSSRRGLGLSRAPSQHGPRKKPLHIAKRQEWTH